jgi:hypothetical protein
MPDSAGWLIFVHQLPPKPDYLRVKIRRRLHGIGAALIKSTVYVLPDTEEALEDFEWLREEIEASGGNALIARVAFVAGISDEEIEAMLAAARPPEDVTIPAASCDSDSVEPGRTWVTREGVFVDRIASAWLIRRFIDPQARFRFVARGYKPRPGELRFDMVGGEYTHVGEACTFQTLLHRFAISDRALAAVGEVVHDIDCKDEKFARAETAGVFGMLRGVADATDSDQERIERGSAVFENLYTFYRARRS